MQKTTAVNKQEGGVFCPVLKKINPGFIMKVSVCCMLLITTCAQLLWAVDGHAQGMGEKKITLELQAVTLKEALTQVGTLSGFQLAYPSDVVQQYGNISIKKATRTVSATLDLLLQHTGLGYRQVNNRIILYKTDDAPADRITDLNTIPGTGTVARQVADGIVRGRVTDEQGAPMLGVTVVVKGTSNGTITGDNGMYELKNVPAEAILVFTIIGFEKQQLPVNGQSSLDVILKTADASKLNEVVVIGYGTTTQRSNTGAVSSITSKDIAQQPVGDPLAALQGRVPGLMITSSNGLPGSSFRVRLRGQNAIRSTEDETGNDPLYIIDGVPFIATPLNQFTGANGSQSPLSSINPADIERIDVLKDADATAIYGSRGANGVILITTKRGQSGQTQVNVNVYTGASRVTNMMDMLNVKQYLQMRRDAFKYDDITPTVENAPDLMLWDTTQSTNWQKLLMGNTAKVTEGQVSVSGGNAQTRFLLSGTYRHETTVQPGKQGYNRGAAHLNIDHSTKNGKFNVTASVNYSADKNNSVPSDVTQYYNMEPNYPLKDSTGALYWYNTNSLNPLALLLRRYTSRTNNLIGNAVARYTILPGLNLKVNLGYTNINMDQVQTYPQAGNNPLNETGSMARYGDNSTQSYIVEPQADYTRQLGKGTLQLLAGATWQQSISEGNWIDGSGYSSDAMLENIKAASGLVVRSYNYTLYRYQSIFGRINYNWQEKYFINATFRRDGSSRFGPNKRFGNFGAVGAAWIFTGEHFISDHLPFLSYGKLRGSYGVTGNDQIGDYGYLDSWSPSTYPYDGVSSLYPSRLFNPDYSWEVNKKLEAAIELGFLDDRILLIADYYHNRSGSQLVGNALSPQTGFESITANLPALVQNSGWEFVLNTTNIKSKDFSWNTSLNVSVMQNKLLKFPGLEASAYAYDYEIGQSLSIVKGYHFTGIDTKTGVPQFQDINGDSTVSELDDYVRLGKKMPDFYGGIQNSFTYKGWELSFLFQFVKQEGPTINYGYQSSAYGLRVNQDLSALRRWRQPGDVTNIPAASGSTTSDVYSAYSTYYRLSDAEWKDASYIRLKNISLRYDLSKLSQRIKMAGCSIYVQAQNLLTFTKYEGFDPETQGLVLPPMKTFTAGMKFSF